MSTSTDTSAAYAAADKGPSILAIIWSITGISTLFMVGRLYVRGFMHRKLGVDDYFIVGGQVCSWMTTALSTVAVSYGNGRHFSTLTTPQMEGVLLWTTAAFCPGVMSFALPKFAVIVLLTRLLNPSKQHKYFLWGLGTFCILVLWADVGLLLGQCQPTRSMWDFSVEGHCLDPSILINFSIFAGSYSAFVDFYLAVWPAFVLFKLQLSLRKKLALSFALGIGSVSGFIAIYKCTRLNSLGSADYSYDTADLVIWTVIEGSSIIIASSIPILQPLMELILNKNIFSSRNKSSKNTPRYYEDYSKQSKSGIELGQRKPKSKPKDDLGLTIMQDDESQENILSPEQRPTNILNDDTWNHTQSDQSDGKILRTKVITVTYDNTEDENSRVLGNHQWKAI